MNLDYLGKEMVDDSYECWAYLYGKAVSGTGDVVMTYDISGSADSFDAVSMCVASYYNVDSVGSVGDGANNPGSPTSLYDSITTSADDSLIIGSLVLGGPETVTAGTGSAIVDDIGGERIHGAMLSMDAASAGTYGPGATFTTANRAALYSVELQEVPEPATMSLLVLGGIGMIIRKRRRA